ncbi:hypothetical protein PB2503_09099 [Parvularcula bermudensis HTCC2503]|uniref:Uncharacterized protein n=2 Tax=Parvularcula TaxID=208215 RepID=E0TCT4_PARBH|nr:hypothetical protein PB2503_09099 [Parvularcula bermudensis HTCC2503]
MLPQRCEGGVFLSWKSDLAFDYANDYHLCMMMMPLRSMTPPPALSQDDLWLLSLLRGSFRGEGDQVTAQVRAWPGRAEGRILGWSIDRLVGVLRTAGRRPFDVGTGPAPTSDERRLLSVIDCLAESRPQAAQQQAQWLVKGSAIGALCERAAPLAKLPLYGAVDRRRRQTRAA